MEKLYNEDGDVYFCIPMYDITGIGLFTPSDFSCNKGDKK